MKNTNKCKHWSTGWCLHETYVFVLSDLGNAPALAGQEAQAQATEVPQAQTAGQEEDWMNWGALENALGTVLGLLLVAVPFALFFGGWMSSVAEDIGLIKGDE